MKKIVITLLTLVSTTAILADDYAYGYLAFVDSNGTEQTITTDGLKITFADGQLVAVSEREGLTLSLADLAKMYFTTTPTGIADVSTDEPSVPVKAYSAAGVYVGTYATLREATGSLRSGVYVIKTGEKTFKLAVK